MNERQEIQVNKYLNKYIKLKAVERKETITDIYVYYVLLGMIKDMEARQYHVSIEELRLRTNSYLFRLIESMQKEEEKQRKL